MDRWRDGRMGGSLSIRGTSGSVAKVKMLTLTLTLTLALTLTLTLTLTPALRAEWRAGEGR